MIKSKRINWVGHVARKGEMRNAYKILVENPKGKRPLMRPRRRWQDNITIYVWEIGLWIEFVWLRIRSGSRLL
jgi:hypothetical protein